MSGAILSSIIRWSVDTLSAYLVPQSGHEDGVYKLKSMMADIQATLDEAEERNVRENSERLRLEELKLIAYDAEDFVGEWEYEVLRSKVENRRKSHEQATKGTGLKMTHYDDAAACYPMAVPQGMVNRVREITERFEEITREWERLCLPERAAKKKRVQAWKPPETASFGLHETSIVGRDEEKESLINFLLSEEEQDDGNNSVSDMVSVIPVLGMGGVGKTTLAQMVYNEPRVRAHFQHRGWICISDQFDVVGITRKIIRSLTGEVIESTQLDELQDTLNQELRGRRFLLVLDDVWNDESGPWESLKAPLLSAGEGKVIVTTRNESVARIVQTVPPLKLGALSSQDSWILFEKLAFEGRNQGELTDLVEIGMKIVERCKGLPLAIKVLGCILRNEREGEIWAEIMDSELWEIDDEEEILPALKLSYDRMPAHLKRCFMYLSLFPKAYSFGKDQIVQLWMAQGLLQKGDRELEEDSGYAYIDEMLQRSILQHPYDDDEETDEFVMHDLIHDLAQLVAGSEYLRIAAHEASVIPPQVRHLSMVFKKDIELTDLKPVFELKLLRTLLIFLDGYGVSHDTFDARYGTFEKLKFLRALDIRNIHMTELPDSICGLKHLRYLRLPTINSFPESMCKLHNLQVIDIETLEHPELPRGIGNLINLRHLIVHGDPCTPHEVGELTNLQTLQNVRVDRWHCSLQQLKDLVNLRGSLTIFIHDNIGPSEVPPKEKYLRSKKLLKSVSVRWDGSDYSKLCSHYSNLHNDDAVNKGAWHLADQVLEGLEPNANIEWLDMVGYTGSNFPRWMGYDSFSKLHTLRLAACARCEFLPPLGQLPSLKNLMIDEMERVTSVGHEFCALDLAFSSKRFPSLEYLQFDKIDAWTEWHDVDSSDFPCLTHLEIENCMKLVKLPKFLCSLPTARLQKFSISSCPSLNMIPEQFFAFLIELYIKSSNVITAAPSLPMLQSLFVIDSSELSILDLKGLPSLRELTISDCTNLRSLIGLGSLASLSDLKIDDCPCLQISEHEALPPSLERVCIIKSREAKNWYQNQKMGCANQSHPWPVEEEFSESDADSDTEKLDEEDEKYFDMEKLGVPENNSDSEGTEELNKDSKLEELSREEDNDTEIEEDGEFAVSGSTKSASSGCKRQAVQLLKHKKKRS